MRVELKHHSNVVMIVKQSRTGPGITPLGVSEVQMALPLVVNTDYLLDWVLNHIRDKLLGMFVREFADSLREGGNAHLTCVGSVLWTEGSNCMRRSEVSTASISLLPSYECSLTNCFLLLLP